VLTSGPIHRSSEKEYYMVRDKDGQGMVTDTFQGIGKFTAPGTVSFRGSIFFRTPSTSDGENCRVSTM
jgi:hypothetical protein